ncbi:MAG: GTPase Era [Acidobacteria bacterium]|nr:GTPase Era [Acidobacteriota bacterium]
MKTGYVSIIGRPNAGKSTLMNAIVGEKVAITSDKPQTTRKRIVGVANVPGGQIAFLDTPGIHKPIHRMNQRMVDAAVDALREADVAVLVIDVTEKTGAGDHYVLDMLEKSRRPVILAINKVDRVKKNELLPIIAGYAKALPFLAIVPISAFNNEGLDGLVKEVLAALPEGDPLFDDDYLTDQSVRSMSAELVREKVLRYTRDELPFTTAVVIDQFEEAATEGGLTKIYATILVETDSQKPIIIGKGGAMIKQIGTDARMDLQKLLGGKVFLELHVKVKSDWRDDERILNEL